MSQAGDQQPARNDRLIATVFILALTGLFAAELLRDYQPVKLSVVFMVLLLLPLTALHEAAHAVVSAKLGWRVCRVVIGFGHPWLKFRVGLVPVDICTLPVSGFTEPVPIRLRRPRLESFLIYAAGPAAEALLALVVIAVVGPSTILKLTDDPLVIFCQSLGLLVAIDLVFNLIPRSVEYPPPRMINDGLGMLLSPFLPDWHFRRLMTRVWQLRAERSKEPAKRLDVLRHGLDEMPDNPFMHLLVADALFEAGDPLAAREHRLIAYESQELPEQLRVELRSRFGLQ